MKGKAIPDQNHIARYCRSTCAPEGQIQASAFLLREDEESLSVNWLEILNCSDRETEIKKIRNIYSLKFNRIGRNAKIIIFNVGDVRNKIKTETSDHRNLEVLHEPSDDISHSAIYNLKPDNLMIAELILEIVNEHYSACQ